MPHSILAVANEFIRRSQREAITLTNTCLPTKVSRIYATRITDFPQ